jgi:FkbM family methyltransferase
LARKRIMLPDYDSSLVTVTYDDISVVYQPISEANRQSLLSGSYNERMFMPLVLREYLEAGDVIFDIGANTGMWTIPMAKKLSPSGMVYAFEPEGEAFQAIEKNVALNELTNVVPLKIAIADADGTADFYIRPGSELHSLFAVNPLSDDNEQYVVRVKTAAIDSLVRSGSIPLPTFLKIDVEGAELLVLEGMSVAGNTKIRHILLELHNECLRVQGINNPPREIENKLNSLGFTQIKYLDDIHLMASRTA